MLAQIINRTTLFINPTNSQLENYFICNLLSISTSGYAYELKRYYALRLFATSFSTIKWSGKSLSGYLDYALRNASSYKPDSYYINADFEDFKAIGVDAASINTFTKGNFFVNVSALGNFSVNIFNSSHTRIDFKRFASLANTAFQKYCFYFAFLTSQKQAVYLNFNVCGNSSSSFTNGLV